MSETRIQTFAEFWPFYLGEHRLPATRAIHVVGTLGYLSLLAAAIATQTWWWIALCPVVAYGNAWFAHFVVEKNRPATFEYPLWSLWADHVMTFKILTFQLGADLRRLGIDAKAAAQRA